MIWFVLFACGRSPTDACQQMLDCDAAWASADSERDAEWAGDDDPTYGAKGSCWDNGDNEVACDAACSSQLIAYTDELTNLVDEGELDGVPAACE